MCWIIHVSYVFKSSYVHVNTSRYYLNRQTKVCLSFGGKYVPRFMKFRSFSIPILIYWCISVELWVLVFLGPLKQFFKSYSFLSETTPLGMKLLSLSSFVSYRDCLCTSSSIVASLKISALTMKCSIPHTKSLNHLPLSA